MSKLLSMLLILCTVISSVISLSSCHGLNGIAQFDVPSSFDETQSYEISFWAKNDTNMTQTEIYKKAIENFQKIYPNIKVNLRLYTDYGKIYNDVITNIQTNTTPNVCITYPDHIATYMTGGNTVVNLDNLLTHPEFGLGGSLVKFDSPSKDEIVNKFLDECKINGSYYALPFMRSTEACYINKTYVEALGYTLPEVLTWDFVFEVSEAAMAKNEDGTFIVNGQNVLIPFIYKSTDNMMIQALRQMNGGYSTENGEILMFNEDTKNFLYKISAHAATKVFSTFKISSYPANFLNAGQCIFAIDSTAGATWMGCDAPLLDIAEENIVRFETVVMDIPQFNTENKRMISQGPSVCIFNKADEGEVLASWLFTQYLLTNDVQLKYSSTEGYAPVTTKALESQEYKDYLHRRGEDNDLHYSVKIDATKLLLDNIENTFVTPVFNGSASLRNAAGHLIETVTKSTRRKETIDDDYMEKLFSDTVSMYRLDQINGTATASLNLGPLPLTAVYLLLSLVTTWLFIIAYLVVQRLKKNKNN